MKIFLSLRFYQVYLY